MPEQMVNVQVQAPKAPEPAMQQLSSSAMIPQMSGEGYKLIDRLLDPRVLYLDSLSTYLYSAHLTKTAVMDPDSPWPGYTMTKIGGDDWHPNMNMLGYTTTSAEVLMALAEDGSVTRFPDDFKLAFFCARQTMAIIGMMIANREDWKFTNYTMIYPFGMTLWKAMVSTLSRSRAEEGKRTLLDLLIHPNLWFSQGFGNEEKPKNKWFSI
jgi:hypothetical protein